MIERQASFTEYFLHIFHMSEIFLDLAGLTTRYAFRKGRCR